MGFFDELDKLEAEQKAAAVTAQKPSFFARLDQLEKERAQAGIAPPDPEVLDNRSWLQKTEDAVGDFLQPVQDIYHSALTLPAKASQQVVDMGRLVTGDKIDRLKDLSQGMGNLTSQFESNAYSPEMLRQKENIARYLGDPSKTIADLPDVAAQNLRGATGDLVQSLGSMFIPALAGAKASALARALRIANPEKVILPTVAGTNAAMNASDTFTATEDRPLKDRYRGAAISAITSLLANTMTGGAADQTLAKLLSGNAVRQPSGSLLSSVVQGAIKDAGKEGFEEFVEESGNAFGETAARRENPDYNEITKRGGYGGLLGAGAGGAVGSLNGIGAPISPPVTREDLRRAIASELSSGMLPEAAAENNTPDDGTGLAAMIDKLGEDQLQNAQTPPQKDESSKAAPAPKKDQPAQTAPEPNQAAANTTDSDGERVADLINNLGQHTNLKQVQPEQNQEVNSALTAPAVKGAPAASEPKQTPILQNRNRATKASVMQMRNMANNLDYGRTGFSRDLANGAPVVAYGRIPENQLGKKDFAVDSQGRRVPVQYAVLNADDITTSNDIAGNTNSDYGKTDRVNAIAGNGRVTAMQHAYQNGKAQRYRAEFEEDGMHGIDPAVIKSIAHPVLVRVMPDNEISSDIGDRTNTSSTLRMNPIETARNDMNRIDLSGIRFNEDGSPSMDSVSDFVRGLPEQERAQLISPNGQPTVQAIDRLNNAIFQKAYGSDRLTELYAVSIKPEGKRLLNILARIAPKAIQLEGAGDLDIRPLLVSAVEELLTGLNQGKKLEDVARQVDAFSDPDVMEFKKLFAISGRDVSKPVHVLEATFDFAIAAKKEAEEGSMFDIPQVTRADTMRELSHQMEEKHGRKATGFTTLNENTSGTVRAQEDAPRRDSGGNPSQDDDRGSGDDQKDAQQKEISARAKTAGEGEINSFWEPWSKPEESSRDDTIELLEGEYGLEPDEIVHASNLGYVIVADDGILSAKFYGHPSKAVRDHLKRTGWRWSFIFKEWRHSNKKKAREEINSFLSRFAEKESDDEMMFSQSGTSKTSETESLEHVKNEIAGLVGKDTLQAFEESGRVKFVSDLGELPKDIQKAVKGSSSESTSDEKGSPEATRERWPQKEGLTTPYPSSGSGDRLSLKDLEIKYSKDGRVQGIYDPRTGKSFIITGNLDKDSAPGVFLHEVGVHMAADKEFRAVMKPIIKRGQQIVNVGFRNGDPIAAEAHKRLVAAGEKESNAEEATAYLVEAAISAKKVSNPIARWLRQVKVAVNAWLIRHGFRDVNKLKTQDIADIALSNVRAMAAKPASGTNPIYDRPNLELAFSITDSAGPGNSHSANTSWGFGPMITKDEFGKYQFGWGQKLYDGGARVLKRTFNLVDQLANNQFQLGMMGKELRKQMRQFKADQENIMYELEPIIKEMSSWDIPEREMVSDIIEKSLKTGVIPTDRAVRVAAAIQDIFNRQTDELLALGGISKESAERWRGQYLPRIYDRSAKEFQKNVFDAFFGRNKPIHSITGSHLKGRGIFETATNLGEIKQYAAMGWEVRDPNWKYENGKLEYVGNDPRAVSLFGSNSDQLISEGVTVWRDFSQEERLLMGEVRDALSRFILGYMATQRDLAVMRLYQSLAEDTRFSRGSPAEGYVYVPDVTIEGAGGVKKYGKLSGRYVTQEVFSQLHNVAKSSGWLNQAYKKMLSAWKEGKTVLSPVAHFNNTVGNLTMAHFAGVSYWDLDRYIDTANEFIKGDTPIIKEATKYGLFSGSFAKEEMAKLVPDPTIRELLKSSEGGLDKGINLVNGVLSWGLRSKLRSAYEFEDSFFKLMLYKKAREEAFMGPEDAVDWATSYIFTYDDLPSGAAMIRDYGAPFFAWTYKAIPCLLHTAFTHPERFLCPAAVLYGLDMASYFLMAGGGDDDDLLQRWERARKLQEYERELLPDYMKGLTAFGTPKSIRIFNDSLTGQAQFLDISRWVPGGDMLDAENQMGGIELFQPLMPSHPLIGVFLAMIANKDSFTGKEVVNKAADTNVEITVKRMEWLAKSLSPALAPWGYHGTRLAQAISYETGHGHLKDLPGAKEVHEGLTRLLGKNGFTGNHVPMEFTRALQHTVGIKNRLVDFEYQEQMAGVKAKAEISAIKKQYQAKVRMANKQKLPMENLQEDFRDAAERIRRILQKERERRSKLAESKKGLRK